MTRLAALLRGAADRLDPPEAAPAETEERLVWRSRDETREIQRGLLRMIDDWIYLSRIEGREADGLMWIPRDVLSNIAYFIHHELDTRDRDYENVERDPTVVLR
ncbi:MAG: hypothetical protein ACLGI5_20815 [Thermoleophilia bacterium]